MNDMIEFVDTSTLKLTSFSLATKTFWNHPDVIEVLEKLARSSGKMEVEGFGWRG